MALSFRAIDYETANSCPGERRARWMGEIGHRAQAILVQVAGAFGRAVLGDRSRAVAVAPERRPAAVALERDLRQPEGAIDHETDRTCAVVRGQADPVARPSEGLGDAARRSRQDRPEVDLRTVTRTGHSDRIRSRVFAPAGATGEPNLPSGRTTQQPQPLR